MEYRELFGGSVGYLDILLKGNRVVDPKDWTGWGRHSADEQGRMLAKLEEQARKYLSNPDYTLKFEFKESIPDPVAKTLNELARDYGGRLSWEAIP